MLFIAAVFCSLNKIKHVNITQKYAYTLAQNMRLIRAITTKHIVPYKRGLTHVRNIKCIALLFITA